MNWMNVFELFDSACSRRLLIARIVGKIGDSLLVAAWSNERKAMEWRANHLLEAL